VKTPFRVEIEREDDGRWISEAVDMPGVAAYGTTRDEAMRNVEVLALRVLADRVEHGEPMRNVLVIACLLLVSACAHEEASLVQPVAPSVAAEPEVPKYLQRDPELMIREGRVIVYAPLADNDVAKSYARSKTKGALTPSGERLTILTAKTTYAVGEEIRVIHVYEATRPGVGVYVMGPKAIGGETIDGVLVTPPSGVPAAYDGAVVPSPWADFNYDITVYRLPAGRHVIRWTSETPREDSPMMASNEIVVDVR